MKRIIYALILVLWTASGFAGNGDGYEIKVRVKGVKNGKCFLANNYGDKQYLKDSIISDANGNFTFKGKEPLEGGIYLVVLPGRKYFEIIISEQKFSVETDTADYVQNMKVLGSTENELFYHYLNYINPRGREVDNLRKRMDKNKDNKDSLAAIKSRVSVLDNEVINYKKTFMVEHPKALLAKVFRAMQEPEIPDFPRLANGRKDSIAEFNFYKSHYFDNLDFSDDRIIRTPIYHNKIKQYMTSLTLQIPDSINKEADYLIEKARASKELFKYTVWYITNTYETSNIMGMDAVFVHMVDKYYKTNQATWVDSVTLYKIVERGKTLKPLLLGKKAPNLIMKDRFGKIETLHNVNAKYTVLCFWDPDCSHCKKEIPVLKEIYDQVKTHGVQVYGVCTEVEIEKWTKFIDEYKLDWINVADPTLLTNFRKTYDINSTPILYLLDEKKEILAKKLSIDQLGDLLEKNMKMKINFKREEKEKEKNKAQGNAH